jgi:sigma-B regulation protein RsbU (phosphoserine phosphatase)
MQVLIVEDAPLDAKVLQLTLQGLGHSVVVARNGTEAWAAFERQPQRLIISDWMMPSLDGLAFCRKVRARPHTPYAYFILLTVLDASDENLAQAADAGADDFLTKPLQPIKMRMRLRAAERILTITHEVSQLQGLIPLCYRCHRVRQDPGHWERVDTYLSRRTGVSLTHGLCPRCFEAYTAKLDELCPERLVNPAGPGQG